LLAKEIVEKYQITAGRDGTLFYEGRRLLFPEVSVEIMCMALLSKNELEIYDHDRLQSLISFVRFFGVGVDTSDWKPPAIA